MRYFLIVGFCIFAKSLLSQKTITQTIRGKVVDQETFESLPGVTVILKNDSTQITGVVTDEKGNYMLENVLIGKYTLRFSYIGYKEKYSTIVLTSAKEYILDISLEETAIEMAEVEVTATRQGEVLNDMALISARQFSVEETQRYAGSRGDPARMASNYAGVLGTDDSRNDIVVRGNSPLGVIWMVEGVNIPNPNHFSISGSQGGPVSIINNKIMGNSDFFAGAFPAEYGNSISGIFDLKLRNGNNRKHEFSAQLGFLGTEVLAEGPISKEEGASYIAMYRYSTIGLFNAIGIPIGTSAVPKYQDAAFKVNFPYKKGSISFWGIGGNSSIDILISTQTKPSVDLYGENDRDQYFKTGMGVVGITLLRSFNNKSFTKLSLATSLESQKATHNFIARQIDANGFYQIDSMFKILDYRFVQGKNSISWFYNQKLGSNWVLKTGINTDQYLLNLKDSVFNDYILSWNNRFNYEGSSVLVQPYVQIKYMLNSNITIMGGLHAQYFSLNNSNSWFEPRINVRWQLTKTQMLSFGIGKHSQLQPMYTYFQQKWVNPEQPVLHNIHMDFSKSNHYIVAYDQFFAQGLKFKTEVYYQQLYQIPVEINPSSFSMINMGSGFARFFPDSLKNTGTGTNYGIEFTLEKAFQSSFFVLLTGSVYSSKYIGSDGIERNTSYNGRYALNFLLGKEIRLNERSVLSLGSKITRAGGRRYGLVDSLASNIAREVIFLDEQFNEFQFRDYFRFDLKINVLINKPRLTHEIGLDLVNVLNTQNILSITYAPGANNGSNFTENYQLGFLPIFYYKIDF